jgi:nucleoside-diphosphate-sugar epimerase
MDNDLIHGLGWQPRISLPDGIANAYEDFLKSVNSGRLRS